MKNSFLAFMLIFINLNSFSQIPRGRYFDEIDGTVWQTSEGNDKVSTLGLIEIGLSIIEIEIDPLEVNKTLWSFKETLTFDFYDAETKKRKTILECKYELDTDKRILKLFIENQELEFGYASVSTEAYIGLTRKK